MAKHIMQWYYTKNEKQIGPLEEDTFRSLVTKNEIKPETLVWNESMTGGWAPYSTVMEDEPKLRVARRDVVRPQVGQELGRVSANALVKKSTGKGTDPTDIKYAGFFRRLVAAGLDVLTKVFILAGFAGGAVLLKLTIFSDPPGKKLPIGRDMLEVYRDFPDLLRFDAVTDFLKTLSLTQNEIYVAAGLCAVAFLCLLFYKPYWTGKSGRTLGKRLMKCRVVRSDLEPLTNKRAFGRFCAELLSFILILLGYLMIAFDKQKRSLHDRICDTRVVKDIKAEE